ncbi:MAG: hypothetical protein CSYNP_00490 [Syntrophus sp. SKADARSKE-3]|nr:hypothetical protein [Syntrophus sp. SKADARSKE-3]
MAERLHFKVFDTPTEARLFRAFLYQYVPLAIIALHDQRILEVNESFLILTGLSREQLIGHPYDEFDFWPSLGQQEHLLAIIERQGSFKNVGSSISTASGDTLDLLWSGITAKHNGDNYIILSVVDVTMIKRMAQSLEETKILLDKILASIKEAIFVVSHPYRNILFFNRAAERLFGYNKEELLGQPTEMLYLNHEMFVEFGRRYFSVIAKRITDDPVFKTEYQMKHKDGTVIVTDHTVTPIINEDGSWLASVSAVRDITEKKQAEMDMLKKSKDLEEAITALKVLLKEQKKDQEETEKKIFSNIRDLILPFMEELKHTSLSVKQSGLLTVIENNLDKIESSLLSQLKLKFSTLTPREIEIAILIRERRSTKEIAGLLNLSPKTVEFHRNRIRRKMGLENNKINLQSSLLKLDE